MIFPYLTCPLDGLPLVKHGNSMRCSSNHNYDMDRKGTLNLLPVQFKKSLHPGDSKDMVLAREAFLNTGLYQPIADALCRIIAEEPHAVILDAGCGEGYYTAYLKEQFPTSAIAGLDISKEAIQGAVKRRKDIQWLVGTNANLPIASQSVDVLISLFGFPVWSEFARVLKPGGRIITVDSGPDHLIELRKILYPEIKEKPAKAAIDDHDVALLETRVERFAMTGMTLDDVARLIAMTPHQHRAQKDAIQKAITFSFEAITADVLFSIYAGTVTA